MRLNLIIEGVWAPPERRLYFDQNRLIIYVITNSFAESDTFAIRHAIAFYHHQSVHRVNGMRHDFLPYGTTFKIPSLYRRLGAICLCLGKFRGIVNRAREIVALVSLFVTGLTRPPIS